jgi:hypothetical protein
MLVPVSGRIDPAELNRRHIAPVPKVLQEQDPKRFPPTYIFNVGPRRHEFPPTERGARFLEACPKGQAYSKPLIFRNIEMEVYDLADGGGNMGRLEEEGIDKARALVHSGVDLSIDTPNLEWLGVFVTENEKPTAQELSDAKGKLNQYMRLVYDHGSELLQQGTAVVPGDRKLYNEASVLLGMKPLFGVSEHTFDRCVFCKEVIQEGAIKCKSCGERLDGDEAKKLKAVAKVA